MIKKRLLLVVGLVVLLGLPLFAQVPNTGGGTTGTPATAPKGTKKPNIIKLGRFEREKGLVTELYQVNPWQSAALKNFLTKWITPKGTINEYEDLRLLEITDTPESLDKVNLLLGTIDKPEPQILIEARITEITTDTGFDLGIEVPYGTTPPGIHAYAGGTTKAVDDPVTYIKNIAAGTGVFEGGTAIFSGKDNLVRLDAVLRALATKGIVKIISSPQILTINGQEAQIKAGQSFPYVASSALVGNTFQNQNQYMDVGVTLTLTPYFIGEETIELVVAPEVKAVTGSQQVSQGVTMPVLSLRSASTKVNVKNGETVALGGLLKEEKLTTEKKIPLLGFIPILGELFTSHHDTTSKTNLVFFLTPRLITESKETLPPSEGDGKKQKEGAEKKDKEGK